MSTPALRFKEFTEKWTVEALGCISKISSGGTPSRGKKEYWNGKIPWVTTSLIDSNIIQKVEEYITEEGLKNSSAKLFPKNTILMAMYGQGKTRGKVAILDFSATTNQACAAIIPNEDIEFNFLFQNLCDRYDEIRGMSNSGSQENLSSGLIKEIIVSFPSFKEQTKISKFLSAIDQKINHLTQKHELLEQYKKGVMQKIFSQEIRFKDDEGGEFPEWDNCLFIDLADK